MAKKKKEESNSKEFTFGDLHNSLKSYKEDVGEMGEDMTVTEIDEYIHTGNYMLNAQLSGDVFKGIPNNKVISIAGESGCLYPGEKITIYKMKTREKNRNFYGQEYQKTQKGK